jgi:uncharacterized protein (PEP-CTERM system associated)
MPKRRDARRARSRMLVYTISASLAGMALAPAALAQRADPPADQYTDSDSGDQPSGGGGNNSGGSVAPDSGGGGGTTVGADVNLAPPPPAFADTVLPTMGANPTSADMRSQLLDAFGDTQPPPQGDRIARGWEVIPVMTVAEEWTDDPGLAAGSGPIVGNNVHGSDFVTLLEPSLTVLGDTDRLQATLHYAPIGEIFAENSNFTQVRENADGDVLATLMPGWLYFDARGSISQQPVFGGLGVFSNVLLSPSERETVSSVAATPYIDHTFGDIGTLEAGVSYLYSATDAPDYLNSPGQFVPLATSYNYGSSWLATERAFGSFTTGQFMARLQDRVSVDASFYDGSGELRGGRRVLATDDASYALNRFISLLGQVGYENADYSQAGFRYVGAVGAAGVRVTPSPNSTITAEYRYVDGVGAPFLYGSWQITPHIRVFGGYSEGIESFDQDQQAQLLAGNLGATGAEASGLIAAPLLGSTGLYAGDQALNKVRRLDASAVYIGSRDIITASFDWEHTNIVGNPYGLPTNVLNELGLNNPQLTLFGFETSEESTNYDAGIDWSHDLTDTLNTNIYVGYDHSHNAAVVAGSSEAVLVSASLTKAFTQTLSAALTYAGTFFISGTAIGDFNRSSNTVTVSVTKRF